MKPIAAIFRKDVRRLWPQIAIAESLLAVCVLFDPGRVERFASVFHSFQMWFSIAQILACWMLLISVIHEERLPGDRQYWLTRPITWKSLLIEKLLFVAAFVSLPLFLAQSATLLRAGIPPAGHLSSLLWRQAFFHAVVILPVIAFAAVTRNLGQAILTAFLSLVPCFVILPVRAATRQQAAWGNIDWMRTVLIAGVVVGAAAAILLLQYSRRQTSISRVLLGGTVALLIGIIGFVPGGWILGLRSRWSSAVETALGVTLLDPSKRGTDPYEGPVDTVSFLLPIRIDGLPAGVELLPERFAARIILQRRPVELIANRFTMGAGGNGQLDASVRSGIFEQVKNNPVHLAGGLEFALLRGRESFPAPAPGGDVVAGVGVCFPSVSQGLIGPPQLRIACSTPFPRAVVYLAGSAGRPNWVISPGSVNAPIPTDIGFDVLDRYTSLYSYNEYADLRDVRLYTARPVAHPHLTFSFRDVRLADYVR